MMASLCPDNKCIVYVDMDGVLCDYASRHRALRAEFPQVEFPQSLEGTFLDLEPIEGAIEAYHRLRNHPDLEVYVLTAPSVRNPLCYTEKRLWVEQHLGFDEIYRLILNPNKGLNHGHFLIDDNVAGKGQEHFVGKLIHFGSPEFPGWTEVLEYFDHCYLWESNE